MIDTVFGLDGGADVTFVTGFAFEKRRQGQVDQILFFILKDDFVVTIDQIKTAACQRAACGHQRIVDLLVPRQTELVVKFEIKAGVILPALPLAVVNTHRHQRHRRIVQTQGDRFRIAGTVVLAEQGDLITAILLVHQFAAELRISRQPAFGADVETVSRAFIVIGEVAGLVPVRQAGVAVGAEFQVIGPGFQTHAQAAVITRHVVIIEAVDAVHPVAVEGTETEAGIEGVTGILVPVTKLREQQVILLIIERQQDVER